MAEATGIEESLANIAQSRARIINSVLEIGLKSSAKLKDIGIVHLPSIDKEPYSQIEGCVLHPRSHYSGDQFSRAMQYVLYAGVGSVFPVMMERDFDYNSGLKYEIPDEEKRIIERRMQSSFLVVYPFDGTKLAGSETMDETDLIPALIRYVVFPEDVYEQYRNEAKRKIGPHKVVRNVVRNVYRTNVYAKPVLLTVPDYERALEEIVDELAHPVWVHGVRLPTEEDIRETT